MTASDAPVEGAAAHIDEALTSLSLKKKEWTELLLDKKLSLLHATRRRLSLKMVAWGRAGAEVKGGNNEVMVVTEMLTSVALPASYIHKLIRTLESIRATGKPVELPCGTTASGQKVVKVFPLTWHDRHHVLQPGASAELVLRPEEITVRQAEVYGKDGAVVAHEGRLCAVLGAGNHGFLALKDALVCLFERGEVVACKPHPLMEPWQRLADFVLEPLIQAGYVRVLYLPGPVETRQLLHHGMVDCVHMTGGTATHDAIVWGCGAEEQQRRRRDNDPLLKVPMTSELGCVTPHIVAGWAFTPAELEEQAGNLVVSMTGNNGCNCNSAKVLVLPGDWAQAGAFLDLVRTQLRATPLLPAYYPGVHQRYETFKARYPKSEVIEGPPVPSCRPMGPHLPYLLNVLEQLPADPKAEYAFTVEPFAPVLTVVSLPSSGPVEFLEAATRFANEQLWGSLSCTIVLHPGLEKAHPTEAQEAIHGLRYGLVSVNAWAAISFLVGPCTWGAFAGEQTVADVGSGLGVMGNPYLVEGVQKAIYRTPLTGGAIPKPPHVKPVPLAAAKLVLGYLVDGVGGMLRAGWGQ